MALAFRAWDQSRRASGAAWLAAATALKLSPAMMLPFVYRRDRRAAAVFASVFAAAVLTAFPLGGGLDAWMAFRRDAGLNVESWQTWWHNTLSINGLASRLFVGSRFVTPLAHAPGVARALVLGSAAVLVALAFVATWRTPPLRADARRGHEGCVFALWNVLAVVLNPLAWTHYALLLLLPAALVARATAPGASMPEPTRRRGRAAVAVGLVLLTVPKEAGYLVGAPIPFSPWAAPILSLHLFGALVLFAAAWRAARALQRAPA